VEPAASLSGALQRVMCWNHGNPYVLPGERKGGGLLTGVIGLAGYGAAIWHPRAPVM